MKEKLLKIISDYSNSGRKMDARFFEDFVNIAIQEKGISHRVKNIEFSSKALGENSEGYVLAKYYFYSETLTYYIPGISNVIMDYGQRYGQSLNEQEQRFFGPAMLGQLTLHELEHAKQADKYDFGKDNESKLIRVALDDSNYLLLLRRYLADGLTDKQLEKIVEERKRLLYTNRIYNPIERMAEIRSNVEMANMFGSELSNLHEFYFDRWVHNLISGYEERNGILVSPTETYLNNMGHRDVWEQIKESSQSTNSELIENLTLGLPVAKEAHESIQKMLTKTI